jgi:hypothetical protein
MCGSSTRRSTTRTAEKLEVAAWAEFQTRCRHAGECHVGTRPPWFRLHRRAAPNASHSCSPPGQSAACPVLTTLICPPRSHPPNRTRSRADTPGASRAAQSVVTSKTATSRLSRRGPAAAEPEGATRQVPAALPAGVARPPGLCARGGGRTHHPVGQGARPHGDGQRRASHGDHGVDADARSALAEQEAARGDIGDGEVDAGPAAQRHGAPVTISGATSRRGAPP